MSIYYKYAPYGTNIVVLFYVDYYVYWYTSEALGEWFVEKLRIEIPCEILGIFTLVRVNYNLSDKGSFYFCGSG